MTPVSRPVSSREPNSASKSNPDKASAVTSKIVTSVACVPPMNVSADADVSVIIFVVSAMELLLHCVIGSSSTY